ncbi:substrate-binding domain-containing protein [Agromyces aerolatus]|uniref:substrate-binding domain-containing protein n=1 Tax=Agromyces sp. LY-1074 TaxID=3074080 RepID=UPI002865B203|nr:MULTISPECIES: substrate-binding domain-containing protein [unclassified Agromyces]MDR5701660.1 substrate-binding domain-containing protein [Agromyces sp. LY-1074]MDR5707900.1 substrate-binding domain-containing protein [Agromyces sp. LY-1358]
MPSHPTLADVAEKAGVSASTASIAFSGSGPVSDATKERVLAAAAALGYAGPDPRARSLRRGRSGIVGVVLEERVRAAFLDPVKIRTLDGIAEGIAPLGAGLLLLTDTGDDAQVSVESAPVDAVVLVGCSPRLADTVAVFRRRGIPAVAIEGAADEDILEIVIDNRAATRRGAEYLQKLGHSHVAVVTLPVDAQRTRGPITPELEARATNSTTRDRLLGAREVFPDAPAFATAASSVEEGRIAALALLADPAGTGGADGAGGAAADGTDGAGGATGAAVGGGSAGGGGTADAVGRPTAIIAQSDLLAAGVIRAAEELGLRVPEDLSVLGFDGIRVDGLQHDLTTLDQPSVDKGRAAGEAIVRLLAGDLPEPAAFTCTLHIGDTTAPPRG